ncbi:MAG: PilZ domain-containing protein [Lachnospiraceae bacterium]|nr:PilZ domain-containing protein [Lachnospiraceae bacterium]
MIKRKGYNYRIISQVEYVDENCIGVLPIASSQQLFKFREDDKIDVIYREKDRYWRWENVKAGIATRQDGTQLHVFSIQKNAAADNRRTQFRLDAGFEVTMKYEVENGEQLIEPVNYKTPELELEDAFKKLDNRYREFECRAYLKDMSEGGASIESDVKLEKGAFISFSIDSNVGPVFLRGVVVRVTEDKEHGYFDYSYGVSYIETSKNYINYFYSQQRRLLYESSNNTD